MRLDVNSSQQADHRAKSNATKKVDYITQLSECDAVIEFFVLSNILRSRHKMCVHLHHLKECMRHGERANNTSIFTFGALLLFFHFFSRSTFTILLLLPVCHLNQF